MNTSFGSFVNQCAAAAVCIAVPAVAQQRLQMVQFDSAHSIQLTAQQCNEETFHTTHASADDVPYSDSWSGVFTEFLTWDGECQYIEYNGCQAAVATSNTQPSVWHRTYPCETLDVGLTFTLTGQLATTEYCCGSGCEQTCTRTGTFASASQSASASMAFDVLETSDIALELIFRHDGGWGDWVLQSGTDDGGEVRLLIETGEELVSYDVPSLSLGEELNVTLSAGKLTPGRYVLEASRSASGHETRLDDVKPCWGAMRLFTSSIGVCASEPTQPVTHFVGVGTDNFIPGFPEISDSLDGTWYFDRLQDHLDDGGVLPFATQHMIRRVANDSRADDDMYEALSHVLEDSAPGDLVILAFSGHGSWTDVNDGSIGRDELPYVSEYDPKNPNLVKINQQDESLHVGSNKVSDDALVDYFLSDPAWADRRLMFIFDTCFGGGFSDDFDFNFTMPWTLVSSADPGKFSIAPLNFEATLDRGRTTHTGGLVEVFVEQVLTEFTAEDWHSPDLVWRLMRRLDAQYEQYGGQEGALQGPIPDPSYYQFTDYPFRVSPVILTTDDYDVPPGGFECPVDITGDGSVNTSDFIAYLSAFGEAQSSGEATYPADYDASGAVNTQDFLAYLNEWVAGCN